MVMKALKDEWYVVIITEAYKISIFEILRDQNAV